MPALRSAAERTSATCGARILADGRAVPPPGAPAEVRAVIEAANRIVDTPYVWGGGHRSWKDSGYDCSGAVGYALHGAGMLDYTMVSGTMAEYWGERGSRPLDHRPRQRPHVYMVVAGLRFDTRDGLTARTGPRWHADMPRDPARYFTPRHPAGLCSDSPLASGGRSAADVEADQLRAPRRPWSRAGRARGRRAGPPPWR